MLRFSTKLQKRPAIHLTALIDIVFLLLIFFLLASSFVQQVAVNIVVPEVESENTGLLNDIVVEIDHEGSIWFEKTKITGNQLIKILEYQLKSKGTDTVVIRADRRVQYDVVIETIDAAKLAGAKNLFLVAKQI